MAASSFFRANTTSSLDCKPKRWEGSTLATQIKLGSATCCLSWSNALACLRFPTERKGRSAFMRVGVRSEAGEALLGAAGTSSVSEIKRSLYKAVEGINRGIFGATSEKKSEIEGLVQLLELQNPTSDPTDNLSMVNGSWKLVYSTISILGSKRTKLGLRGFIDLGEFFQRIDVAKGEAVNEIKFNVRGLTMLSGQLLVTSSFMVSSKSRVDINFESSDISPDELRNLFLKNYDLLLAIFNPDGWLEITFVDDSLRIGRDDKENIFILEKWGHTDT